MQRTTELATPENFDEELYLLANRDVARAVANGGSALAHFRRHGQREGRTQAIRSPEERQQRQAERFTRFRHVLDPHAGAGGDYRFLDQPNAFPVAYGSDAYDLDQYEGESANAAFHGFTADIRAHPEQLFLDVGCGRRSRIEPNCLYLEVYRSSSADIVMEPACRYPIASNSLDGVGCFAVLEHVPRPWEAAAEFHRMLKPRGRIYIDWPFLQPVHGYPSHFYNATREGVRAMFADAFDIQQLDTHSYQTPDHTLSWILRSATEALAGTEVGDRLLEMRVGDLAREPAGSAMWQEIVAAMPAKAIETLACGNTLIATKR
jgi:SAM-dependent methyltransferase